MSAAVLRGSTARSWLPGMPQPYPLVVAPARLSTASLALGGELVDRFLRGYEAPGTFELIGEIARGDALQQDLGPALLRPLIGREGVWIHLEQRVLIVPRQL